MNRLVNIHIMALTLDDFQAALNRPTKPSQPNGIAHATNTSTPADTKTDRAATKAAYTTWNKAWKATYNSSGDHDTEFTEAGSGITYADD